MVVVNHVNRYKHLITIMISLLLLNKAISQNSVNEVFSYYELKDKTFNPDTIFSYNIFFGNKEELKLVEKLTHVKQLIISINIQDKKAYCETFINKNPILNIVIGKNNFDEIGKYFSNNLCRSLEDLIIYSPQKTIPIRINEFTSLKNMSINELTTVNSNLFLNLPKLNSLVVCLINGKSISFDKSFTCPKLKYLTITSNKPINKIYGTERIDSLRLFRTNIFLDNENIGEINKINKIEDMYFESFLIKDNKTVINGVNLSNIKSITIQNNKLNNSIDSNALILLLKNRNCDSVKFN